MSGKQKEGEMEDERASDTKEMYVNNETAGFDTGGWWLISHDQENVNG